jgi:hypothetical protein
MQQRGIPPAVIQMLAQFGERRYDHHNGCIRYFSNRARRKALAYLGSEGAKLLEAYSSAYIVQACDAEIVITTGFRGS